MASDGAVGRPMRQVGDKESPGLDAEQFAHKFSARIAREGKYQHNVRAPLLMQPASSTGAGAAG